MLTCCRALLGLASNDPVAVLGRPDNLKLCSCLTLFEAVRTEKRSAGRLLALWLVLQTAVFTAEELLGIARTVGAPFVGSCLAAFVVTAWVLNRDQKMEGKTV